MRISRFLKTKMASRHLLGVLKPQLNLKFLDIRGKLFHTSPALLKVCSGKIKRSRKGNIPVTYEEFLSPPHIAHRKSWNSWNTSTIEGGLRPSEMATDDLFIRKFMHGTFPNNLLSKVIIKRQYNIIRIAVIMKGGLDTVRLSFLIGYTEELLSHWFQCIVKLEIQILINPKNIIFRYL